MEELTAFYDPEGTGNVPFTAVHEILAVAGTNATALEVQNALRTLGVPGDADYVPISTVRGAYGALIEATRVSPETLQKGLEALDVSGTKQINIDLVKFLVQHYGDKVDYMDAQAIGKLVAGEAHVGASSVPLPDVLENLLRLQK